MSVGAPKGNNNAVKGKRWLNAIEKALKERESKAEQQEALVELAGKLLDECAAGNLQALQELGNRLDGKPSQTIDMKVTDMTHEEALDLLEHGSISPEHHTTH